VVESGVSSHISTGYVDRSNLTLRMSSKRFARLSDGSARSWSRTAPQCPCTSLTTICAVSSTASTKRAANAHLLRELRRQTTSQGRARYFWRDALRARCTSTRSLTSAWVVSAITLGMTKRQPCRMAPKVTVIIRKPKGHVGIRTDAGQACRCLDNLLPYHHHWEAPK
jgi:hypothetical protein